jgi:hypothetical protein
MYKEIPLLRERVMYRLNQNQEIVRLLLKLKEIEDDYPVRLFSYRRTSFVMLLARKPAPLSVSDLKRNSNSTHFFFKA